MTLVVDASAVAEVLLGTDRGRAAAPLLRDAQLIAPDILTAEVASVLRGWSLSGRLSDDDGRRGLRECRELGVVLLPAAPLLEDVWALRHNVSAYDACYVALARAQGCSLLTLDARLAAAAPDCAIRPGVD